MASQRDIAAETRAPDVDAAEEMRNAPPAEPLLPVEKKLILWSVGLGVALLALLWAFTARL